MNQKNQKNQPKPKCVVLLSGGLDSAVCLAIAKQSYKCYPLTFVYGQRHKVEVERARALAEGLIHKVIELEIPAISSLLGNGDVPKEEIGDEVVPSTWVPGRNLIFLSIAASYAYSIGARVIFIGVNAVDATPYPDCRDDFIGAAFVAIREAFDDTSFRIHTPLLNLSKAEIIRRGRELGVDFSLTLSCYSPVDGRACGVCPSCRIRERGFKEAGVEDECQSKRSVGQTI